MNKRDYVGQWFEIYRRNNECADILFEVTNGGKTQFINLPHEKVDGAGALFTLAEKFNWKIKNLAPQTKVRPIAKFKYFINCILFLYWTRNRTKNIWPFYIKKSNSNDALIASQILNKTQTDNVKKISSALGVSINTFLFYSLNKELENKFGWQSEQRAWWIPVNMRADLGIDLNDSQKRSNYVSNFTLEISPKTDLLTLQKNIADSLKKQKHWATWRWQHLGQLLPEYALESLTLKKLKNNYYVGAFSNLGEWLCSDPDSNLKFFVPPLQSHPIAAGAIIWNGQLNLSLRFYPTFKLSQNEIEEIILGWSKRLLAEAYN